jgi:hypothetical protein
LSSSKARQKGKILIKLLLGSLLRKEVKEKNLIKNEIANVRELIHRIL